MTPGDRRARDRGLARDTLVVSAILLLVAAALLTVWFTRELVFWLFMAGYLAWSIDPMSSWLAKKFGGRQGLGITVSVLLIVTFFVAIAWIFIPPIVDGARALQAALPGYIDELQASRASQELGTERALDSVESAFDQISGIVSRAGEVIGNVGGVLVGGIFAVFMIVSLMIYFLIYGRRLIDSAERRLGPAYGERLRRVGAQIYRSNQDYWFGKFVLALAAGTTAYLVMFGLGIPFRAPLAFFVGITSLIPNIGATIGTVGVAVVAAFEGWEPLVISVVALIAYQQIENVILTPKVFKKTMDLHPIVSLAGVTAGGMLFGLVGVLVALPLIAAVKIIWREFVGPEPGQRGAEQVPLSDGDPPTDAPPEPV